MPISGNVGWFIAGLVVLAVLWDTAPKWGAALAGLIVLGLLLTAAKRGQLAGA